jgi:hypothetical protein
VGRVPEGLAAFAPQIFLSIYPQNYSRIFAYFQSRLGWGQGVKGSTDFYSTRNIFFFATFCCRHFFLMMMLKNDVEKVSTASRSYFYTLSYYNFRTRAPVRPGLQHSRGTQQQQSAIECAKTKTKHVTPNTTHSQQFPSQFPGHIEIGSFTHARNQRTGASMCCAHGPIAGEGRERERERKQKAFSLPAY